MTMWMTATLALLPALAFPIWVACRGSLPNRLVAVQLATTLTAMVLALMTFVFDQSSFIDLPLCLVLLSLPGTLAITLFVERWL